MRVARVRPRTAADIEGRVDRVHKDIAYCGGKIDLPVVIDRLKLDLRYYQSDDPSLLDEVLHKLQVAGKQVLARPMLFFEAVRNFDLGAFYLPDRKRILVDQALPKLKWRWTEAHEVGHSLLPWHEAYMLGDSKATLSEACQVQIEAEANYAAGRLLFPAAEFEELRRSQVVLTHAHVRTMASHFGNTITSTLWRCIEHEPGLMFACIGEHPRHPRADQPLIKYFVSSLRFESEFPTLAEAQVWQWLRTYCTFSRTGPIGTSLVTMLDSNGIGHEFEFETFSIGYYAHTIARHRGLKATSVAGVAMVA